VAWGDDPQSTTDPALPWPGQLPAPSPTVVFVEPVAVDVVDAEGRQVHVTDRDGLTASPVKVMVRGTPRSVHAWAGPWPADERWWDPAGTRQVRMQVVLGDETRQTALLLAYANGNWVVRAHYD
jgi:protein ImuB